GLVPERQPSGIVCFRADKVYLMPDRFVSACLLAGQLEALHSDGWSVQRYTTNNKIRIYKVATRGPIQEGGSHDTFFAAYLAAFPLSAPPEPSAAEELLKEARYVIDRLCRDEAS